MANVQGRGGWGSPDTLQPQVGASKKRPNRSYPPLALPPLPAPQFVVIIASEVLVQRTLNAQGCIGAVSVVLFGATYAHSRN